VAPEISKLWYKFIFDKVLRAIFFENFRKILVKLLTISIKNDLIKKKEKLC
jgi:hypothetical protein